MTTEAHSPQQPVLVIMGVSGSGKSTVAGILAGQLGWDLEEGDDLHPAANVEKMAAGTPLTDEDRWPWLNRVADWITDHTHAGLPGIITCSALKRIYRDRLRGDHVVFVHLTGSKDAISHRIAARTDHFMPTTLLDSQIITLEPPGPDENVVVIDVARKPADEAAEIITQLHLHPETGSTAMGSAHPGISSAPPLSDLWTPDTRALPSKPIEQIPRLASRAIGADVGIVDDTVHPDDSLAGAIGGLPGYWTRVDAVVGAASLDESCREVGDEAPVNLRRVLMHLLEETARHAGHADMLRELIDGATGR